MSAPLCRGYGPFLLISTSSSSPSFLEAGEPSREYLGFFSGWSPSKVGDRSCLYVPLASYGNSPSFEESGLNNLLLILITSAVLMFKSVFVVELLLEIVVSVSILTVELLLEMSVSSLTDELLLEMSVSIRTDELLLEMSVSSLTDELLLEMSVLMFGLFLELLVNCEWNRLCVMTPSKVNLPPLAGV